MYLGLVIMVGQFQVISLLICNCKIFFDEKGYMKDKIKQFFILIYVSLWLKIICKLYIKLIRYYRFLFQFKLEKMIIFCIKNNLSILFIYVILG